MNYGLKYLIYTAVLCSFIRNYWFMIPYHNIINNILNTIRNSIIFHHHLVGVVHTTQQFVYPRVMNTVEIVVIKNGIQSDCSI